MADKLADFINEKLSIYQRSADRWAQKYAECPFTAFEWGDDAVHNSARLWVWQVIKSINDKGLKPQDGFKTMSEVLQDSMRSLLEQAARFPNRTTNMCHNIVHDYKTNALCEALDDLKCFKWR